MGKSDLLRQLWLAMVLLTRLPLPHLPRAAFAQGARAVWAYPLVGLVVGGAGAGAAWAALALGLSPAVAALIALATMTVLTGAMHEDGLADVCDGFWGGFDPARRLEIMRDSQIGTYGVLALIFVTALRWSALSALVLHNPALIVVGAALSRGAMPGTMALLPHARGDGLSRSVGRPTRVAAMAALGLGALIAISLAGMVGALAVASAVIIAAAVTIVAHRKIGGQTGDVLGATQQLSETAVLLTLSAML